MGKAPKWPETEGQVQGELRDGDALLERLLLDYELRDFSQLRFIDANANGLTVFHQQHIRPLIDELERLVQHKFEADVARHLRAVLEFVQNAYSSGKGSILFVSNT